MGEIVALFSRFVVAISLVLMVACGGEVGLRFLHPLQ